jgi:hypothetical protein
VTRKAVDRSILHGEYIENSEPPSKVLILVILMKDV